MSTTLKVFLAGLVAAAVAGGAVFFWQLQQIDQLKANHQEQLTLTIDQYEGQVNDLKSDVLDQEKLDKQFLPRFDSVETDWELVPGTGNTDDLCTGPVFTSSGTEISGWYELIDLFDQKEWVFYVEHEDRAKLPNLVTDPFPEYYNYVILEDADSKLEEELKTADANAPVTIEIKTYTAYCQGFPSVYLEEISDELQ